MAEQLMTADEVREVVRERYAAAATEVSDACGCDCGPSSTPLGCGNPTAVAELDAGETVLDLGSGGGIVADPDMDEATRRDRAQWTGCIAGR